MALLLGNPDILRNQISILFHVLACSKTLSSVDFLVVLKESESKSGSAITFCVFINLLLISFASHATVHVSLYAFRQPTLPLHHMLTVHNLQKWHVLFLLFQWYTNLFLSLCPSLKVCFLIQSQCFAIHRHYCHLHFHKSLHCLLFLVQRILEDLHQNNDDLFERRGRRGWREVQREQGHSCKKWNICTKLWYSFCAKLS